MLPLFLCVFSFFSFLSLFLFQLKKFAKQLLIVLILHVLTIKIVVSLVFFFFATGILAGQQVSQIITDIFCAEKLSTKKNVPYLVPHRKLKNSKNALGKKKIAVRKIYILTQKIEISNFVVLFKHSTIISKNDQKNSKHIQTPLANGKKKMNCSSKKNSTKISTHAQIKNDKNSKKFKNTFDKNISAHLVHCKKTYMHTGKRKKKKKKNKKKKSHVTPSPKTHQLLLQHYVFLKTQFQLLLDT